MTVIEIKPKTFQIVSYVGQKVNFQDNTHFPRSSGVVIGMMPRSIWKCENLIVANCSQLYENYRYILPNANFT